MEENPRGKEKFSLSTISLFLRESLARNNNPFARGVSHRCILSFLTFRSTDFLKIVCFIQFHLKTIPLQRDAIETIVRWALTNPMNNRQQPRVSRKTAKNTLDITTYATILHYTISMIVRIVQDIDTQLTSLDASTYSSFFFSFFFFSILLRLPRRNRHHPCSLNSFHIKVRNGTQLVRAVCSLGLVRKAISGMRIRSVEHSTCSNGIIPFVRRKNAKRRGPLARVHVGTWQMVWMENLQVVRG